MHLSRNLAWAFGIAVSLLFIALTYGTSRLLAGYITRGAMSQVLDENSALRRQLEGMDARLVSVNRQLTELASSDDHLRLIADLPRIDQDTRDVGVGGAASSSAEYGVRDPKARALVADLSKIEREIRLQKDSFAEIEERMSGRADLLAHTPAIRPVNGGYIGSRFGHRTDPINGRPAFHQGIDITIDRGAPIMATADGKVLFAQQSPGLGKLVIIDHGYGFRTAYGHLSRILVNRGQTIKRGQKIALSGATGRVTGPHLHYEVHVNGKPVDPLDFFFDDNESLALIPQMR